MGVRTGPTFFFGASSEDMIFFSSSLSLRKKYIPPTDAVSARAAATVHDRRGDCDGGVGGGLDCAGGGECTLGLCDACDASDVRTVCDDVEAEAYVLRKSL